MTGWRVASLKTKQDDPISRLIQLTRRVQKNLNFKRKIPSAAIAINKNRNSRTSDDPVESILKNVRHFYVDSVDIWSSYCVGPDSYITIDRHVFSMNEHEERQSRTPPKQFCCRSDPPNIRNTIMNHLSQFNKFSSLCSFIHSRTHRRLTQRNGKERRSSTRSIKKLIFKAASTVNEIRWNWISNHLGEGLRRKRVSAT